MQRVGEQSCELVVNESMEFRRCPELCGLVLGVQRQFVCTLVSVVIAAGFLLLASHGQ